MEGQLGACIYKLSCSACPLDPFVEAPDEKKNVGERRVLLTGRDPRRESGDALKNRGREKTLETS